MEAAFSYLEEAYRRHLSEVRALSSSLVKARLRTFRRFRDFLKTKRVRSARRVSLDLAYEFFERSTWAHNRNAIRKLHGGIRSILRFLHCAGILAEDLSRQMITPRVWELADIPQAFSDKEVARMLANLRAGAPYEDRERVVILLFLCYGLRLGEVTQLRLDDIDWKRKMITVRERKNRAPLILPLIPRVEQALRDYLAHLRPGDLSSGRLLVAIGYSSQRPLTVDATCLILKKFLRRCGLDGYATRFRHTLATRLINDGASLEAIQGLLGHRRLDSTRIYAKVHLRPLREVADNYSLLL